MININTCSNEVIHSNRLTLEPFTHKHAINDLVRWLNDPEVVRYSDQRHLKHTFKSVRAYHASFLESPNHYWAIVSSGSMIGTITAYVDEPNSVADVGILVGDKMYWSSGYGSEAFSAVINWLITFRRVRKITAGTMSDNVSMLRVMLKCGMRVEGRKERYFILDGQEIDMVYSTIFAADSNL